MENIPVLYINLNRRPDRLKILQRDVLIFFNDTYRIEAVDTPHNGYEGCVLSHIKALEYAKSQNWDQVIIMEDDFEFVNMEGFVYPDFDFDVCLIEALVSEDRKEHISLNYNKVTEAQHTGCYLVKNHFYDKLISNFKESYDKLCEQNCRSNYLDIYWFKIQKDNIFIYPSLCIGRQMESYSDIKNKIMKRY